MFYILLVEILIELKGDGLQILFVGIQDCKSQIAGFRIAKGKLRVFEMYIDETEPAYRTGRQEANDTQRDDYKTCEIPPKKDRGRLSRPSVRDKLWPLKNNYKHMKSSMTQATHGGMIIIHAKIPSRPSVRDKL